MSSHPYIQLAGRPADAYELTLPAALTYTMDARQTALAVEPMSCAPNAFNSGDGLVSLAPGERHRFRYRLRVW